MYREYAQLIHASGTHLLNLINDVLDMSKVEAGKFVIEPEAMAVDAVVRESLKMVAVTAEKAGIQFKTAYGDDLPPLYADRRAVRQILLNLLSNAIKFSHEGSTVLIEAVEDGDMILIAVRDYGVGIAEADLARIGRPYEQAKAQTGDGFVKGKGGTGLGLALVRALAGLHGGTMTVQSELGVGTRVIVSLPRHADGMRLPQREPDSEAPDSEAAPEILKGAA